MEIDNSARVVYYEVWVVTQTNEHTCFAKTGSYEDAMLGIDRILKRFPPPKYDPQPSIRLVVEVYKHSKESNNTCDKIKV